MKLTYYILLAKTTKNLDNGVFLFHKYRSQEFYFPVFNKGKNGGTFEDFMVEVGIFNEDSIFKVVDVK